MLYALCSMPYALCPMLYALCSMLYALCSMLYALCPSDLCYTRLFLIFHFSCPMPYALCPMPYALCSMLHVPCSMLHAPCSMFYVFSGHLKCMNHSLNFSTCFNNHELIFMQFIKVLIKIEEYCCYSIGAEQKYTDN